LNPFAAVVLIVASYLLGAAPWGVILGRVFASTDIRGQGSGSTGTTNAYRVLGAKFSVAVLILDFLKGMIPVLVAGWLGANHWVIGLAGLAAVAGHCWSVFIGFSGGKGVATGGGAAFALIPWLWFLIVPMAVILLLTKYMSVASIAVALLTAMGAVLLAATDHAPTAYAAACVAIVAIIICRHRANISRLRAGTELKLSLRSKRTAAA
jgi:acyl phosphate:glycerol-3-phosphate acyltransferase